MQIIVVLVLIAIAIAIFWWALPFLLTALGIYLVYRLIRYVKKEKYFKSPEFLEQKEKIESTIKDFNEVAEYVKEIPNNNQFVPIENKNEYAHLATFENTSKHGYKRDRNTKNINAQNVYPTSLQVVRKASEEPIKYLCKYFDINPTEENLNQLQEIGENISRMENTVENLRLREQEIETDFDPPKFILKYYKKELMEKLGAEIPNINVKYAEYIFEYVSAGGNSSQKSTITFDGETVEATASFISEKIKYKKSAKAQRALMTSRLRNIIKYRDDHTCQICGASTKEQSLLLLEIDHIIPISKGGLSSPDNLQTLCWKCNRTKSDKILS
ncbi:HNH endonuclease [Enterococcus olivae]